MKQCEKCGRELDSFAAECPWCDAPATRFYESLEKNAPRNLPASDNYVYHCENLGFKP